MDTADTMSRYWEIVRSVLTPLTKRRYSGRDAVNEAVFDTENDRYIIMSVGWEGPNRRVHGCLAHLDITNGKIWIQRDGTEYGLAYELEEAGIPKHDIVLGFHGEDVRPHTGYAIA